MTRLLPRIAAILWLVSLGLWLTYLAFVVEPSIGVALGVFCLIAMGLVFTAWSLKILVYSNKQDQDGSG